MRRVLTVIAGAAAICAICCGPVFGMSRTEVFGDGRIYPISHSLPLPEDIADVMNFEGRVYGERFFFSEIGDTETLHFAGDTQAFNRFLELYAKLKLRPLVLTIHAGSPTVARTVRGPAEDGNTCSAKRESKEEEVAYDWTYRRYLAGTLDMEAPRSESPQSGSPAGEYVWVDLYVGGKIKLDEVRVPGNITVQMEPEMEKIAAFVAEHRASGDSQ